MTKLEWDVVGERLYETGVQKGVLYPQASDGSYPLGVAWNGLSSISEKPTGAEASPIYADDTKYLNLISAEEFEATIEAYTYPEEFGLCDGSAEIADGVLIGQQARKTFGLVYRTSIGNDVDGDTYGYKLHIIYGAIASPSEKAYQTINDSPQAITFSWEIKTTPVAVSEFKPTASLVIDSTKVSENNLKTLEDMLYGTSIADPYLPLPNVIATLFANAKPSAVAMSSIDPADGADNAAITADIVMTFNNAISKEAVVVTKNDGTIVEGTKTWNVARKILTFDPDQNLENEAKYLVSISGVIDIYNQILEPVVTDFTTVAGG